VPTKSQIRASWAASAIFCASAGCYDGAFLELACDRQGTCPASSSSSSSTSDETATSDPSTTGEPAPGLHAFRITQLTLVDPHFYFSVAGTCTDVTNFLLPSLADEISKGELNLVLLFDQLDPSAPAVRLHFVDSACVIGTGKTTCSFKPGGAFTPVDALNAADAPYDAVWPGTTNPLYTPPNKPDPVHFSTQRADFVLPMLGTSLPALYLRSWVIAARYATSPPIENLVQGVLTGYLSASEAASINSEIAGIPFNLWETIAGSETCCMPASIVDDTDPDPDPNVLTRGVWFYLNFTATRVEWIE
jgi:hypothetical protein